VEPRKEAILSGMSDRTTDVLRGLK